MGVVMYQLNIRTTRSFSIVIDCVRQYLTWLKNNYGVDIANVLSVLSKKTIDDVNYQLHYFPTSESLISALTQDISRICLLKDTFEDRYSNVLQIAVLSWLGLSANETANLLSSNVDILGRTIAVDDRTIRIPDDLLPIIMEYNLQAWARQKGKGGTIKYVPYKKSPYYLKSTKLEKARSELGVISFFSRFGMDLRSFGDDERLTKMTYTISRIRLSGIFARGLVRHQELGISIPSVSYYGQFADSIFLHEADEWTDKYELVREYRTFISLVGNTNSDA